MSATIGMGKYYGLILTSCAREECERAAEEFLHGPLFV